MTEHTECPLLCHLLAPPPHYQSHHPAHPGPLSPHHHSPHCHYQEFPLGAVGGVRGWVEGEGGGGGESATNDDS